MDSPAKRRRLDSATVTQPPEPLRRSSRLTNRRQGAGCLFRLPFDILLVIFAFLTSPVDRKAVLLTCKEWYAAMSHPSLWRDSCIIIRKASSPLYLWRLLEARQIHSVRIRTLYGIDSSWYATLRRLEKVAPRSVTHLSVSEPPFGFAFEDISGTFLQLPYLKSLSLESYLSKHWIGLKSHHLLNIVELNLSHGNSGSSSYCIDIDFVGLCDAVGSKLQRLSLKRFHLCKCVNGRLHNAVVEIDRLPALVSLELIDCWSYARGPMITKLTDMENVNYSPKFCLSELRIVRTNSVLSHPVLYHPPSNYQMLPRPVMSSKVLCQLSVLEVSNFGLFDVKELSRHWHGSADCLQELNLSCNCLSERGLKPVFRNALQLKSVNLNSNRIGASLLRSDSFTRLPLESLMLADSRLPVARIPNLFPQLVTLDLSGCSRLTDDTLPAMVKLKRLRTLTAKNTPLTTRAVEEFRVLMRNKTRVLC